MEPQSSHEKTIIQKTKSSKTNSSYYAHLEHVKAAAEGKPSITIINNDKDEYLCVNLSNTKTDSTLWSLGVYQNTQMTLCPYLFPDSLNTRQIQNGVTISLSLYTKRLHCFIPYINDNPAIDIKKGMFCHYIKNKNNIYLVHNAEQMRNGVMLMLVNPLKNNTHDFTLHIGNNSTVQFGDTIRVDYDTSDNKIHIIHNDINTIETLPVTNRILKLSNCQLMRRRTC